VNVDNPLTASYFEQFFAILTFKLKVNLNRGIIDLDKFIGSYLLDALNWSSFGYCQSRKKKLRWAMQFRLPIGACHFNAIHRLPHKSHLTDQGIVLLLFQIIRLAIIGFDYDTLLVKSELQNRGMSSISV
jgi:hypothetical protein